LVVAVSALELLEAMVAVPLFTADSPVARGVSGYYDKVVLSVMGKVEGESEVAFAARQVTSEKLGSVVNFDLCQRSERLDVAG
jgi:hypothetical protein